MTYPEARWSREHPVGQVLHRRRRKAQVAPTTDLVGPAAPEATAYRRMREAAALGKRVKREHREVKEGKKKQVSKH